MLKRLCGSSQYSTLVALWLIAGVSSASPPPRFETYPAEARFSGVPAKPLLETALARKFRTVIKNGAGQGPNFAGHFTVIAWGCGSGCRQIIIADAKTGKLIELPFTVLTMPPLSAEDDAEALSGDEFKIDSRLLALSGCLDEDEARCGKHYFVMDGQQLHALASSGSANAGKPAANSEPAASCGLHKVTLAPAAIGNNRTYSAIGQTLDVEVANENPELGEEPVLQPTLKIRHRQKQPDCTKEGGVWDKDAFYLSLDEQTLATVEHSGSNSWLTLLSTADCKPKATLDLHAAWRIEPDKISDEGYCECSGASCACWPASIHLLDAHCQADFLKEESLALNKKLYGVEFSTLTTFPCPPAKTGLKSAALAKQCDAPQIIVGDFNTGKGLAAINGDYDANVIYSEWQAAGDAIPEGEWPLQTLAFTQAGKSRLYFFSQHNDAGDCMTCEADVSVLAMTQTDKGWHVDGISKKLLKEGASGRAFEGELLPIGLDVFGWLAEARSGNRGTTGGGHHLVYEKQGALAHLFIEDTSGDNSGACGEEGADRCHEFSSKVAFVPGKHPVFYDIKVTTTGTAPDESGAITLLHRVRRYEFGDEGYELKSAR